MKKYKICVIEGDGVGKEVIPETVRVLKNLGDFQFIKEYAGYECFKKYGDAIPSKTVETAKECDAILFGAVTTPKPHELEGKVYRSPILTLRRELDLYANIRPISNFRDIDFVIIRENTEGLYVGREYYNPYTEEAVAERVISKKGCYRVVKFAFEYALKHHRKKVTCVHKANVLRVTDGLFLKIFYQVSEEYKEYNIEVNDYLVDTTAMYIVKNPKIFDVIVTTNLFGDILSDEASGLIGGLGLAPSANIGDRYGLFEPVHGSAPDIAGKGIANPLATILSGAMMLYYLGMKKESKILRMAVKSVVEKGYTTPDLGGNLKTREVTDKVIEEVKKYSEVLL
ncbi:MAG TPA: isocitrate/isopropylmalate dehydrogenase family protein [Methanothermococcus okinawensis]|nr:isocitrate/isopropylmalate dehydrogenase family protein [Methanothermococcus okinawensis]